MENLVDLQSQIEKLQKKAAEIKAKEFSNTVSDIVAKMEAFGITIRDLQAAGKKKPRRGKSGAKSTKPAGSRRTSANKGTKVAAKFKGPNGETWSGRGLPPKWMAALLVQGHKKEEFAI
jgi:DNA-binding protein H-NS